MHVAVNLDALFAMEARVENPRGVRDDVPPASSPSLVWKVTCSSVTSSSRLLEMPTRCVYLPR